MKILYNNLHFVFSNNLEKKTLIGIYFNCNLKVIKIIEKT